MSKGIASSSNNQIEPELFSFSPLCGKKISASFTSPDLSSCGGLMLAREAEKECDIIRRICSCIKDERRQYLVKHSTEEMVRQRVYQIACGYEDADDCDRLRDDSIMKMCAGRLPSDEPLASQPSMSRLENKVEKDELYAIAGQFLEEFIASYQHPPRRIILDCDDTNADTYGMQQGNLFSTYYNSHCLMPFLIFEGQSGKLVMPVLRPGRRNKSINFSGYMKRIITRIRKSWKNTQIIVRGDSHFCSHEFMEWARKDHRIIYIAGLSTNAALARRTASWVKSAEKEFKSTKQPIKRFHRFEYKAGTWKESQGVVVKIEVNGLGTNVRYVVTNITRSYKPAHIYNFFYCNRGSMELMIKELKLYLNADRMSCTSFLANQFRLFLYSAAYVLLHSMQHTIFAGTEAETMSIITIRERFILSAVFITEKKTCVKLEFASKHPMRSEMENAFRYRPALS